MPTIEEEQLKWYRIPEEGEMASVRGMNKGMSLELSWMDFILIEMGKVIPSRPGETSVKPQSGRGWMGRLEIGLVNSSVYLKCRMFYTELLEMNQKRCQRDPYTRSLIPDQKV